MLEGATVVFVLGAPGAGKGTQCAKIVEVFGWTHLSTGDLLRAEVQQGTELGMQAQEVMNAGQMVPTSIILELLAGAMQSSGSTRFLIDGYPRKLDQLVEFQDKIKPCDGVLVFTVPDEVAVERLVARGATSGRADDNEDTILARMDVFRAESQPVIDYLKDSGGSVHEVDATGDVEEIFSQVEPFMAAMEEEAAAKAAAAGAAPGAEADPGEEEQWEQAAAGAVAADGVPAAADDGAGGGGMSEEEAAARIQAAGRGYLDRKRVAQMKAEAQRQQQQDEQQEEQEGLVEEVDAVPDGAAGDVAALVQVGSGGGKGGADKATADPDVDPELDGYSDEQIQALTKIQAAGRGYLDRKRVAQVRQAKEAAGDADAAQPDDDEGADGVAAQPEDAEESALLEGYTEEQIQALTKIQAAGRGYLDRKRVAGVRQARGVTGAQQQQDAQGAQGEAAAPDVEDVDPLEGYTEEQIQALTKIQAAGRGYLDRKKVAQARQARTEQADEPTGEEPEPPQPAAEASMAEDADEEAAAAGSGGGMSEEDAVLRIQAAGRGYLDRKRVAQMKAEAQQQQSQLPGGAAADDDDDDGPDAAAEEAAEAGSGQDGPLAGYSEEQKQAAVRIQAAGRGYLDRKKAAQVRQERQALAAAADNSAADHATLAAQEENEEEAVVSAAATTTSDGAAHDADYEAAVTRIQAAGRGYLDRKKVHKLKASKAAAASESSSSAASILEQVGSIKGMLVVCGPSGVGKGTLIGRLMEEHGDKFGFSVSHTTRGPRPGEQHGVHYNFATRDQMERDIAAGLFLEHAAVHSNMYGTSLSAVAAVGRSGRIAVLDIDVQGATKVKASRAAAKARYIFVAPPSLELLEARLRGRGTEAEDKIQLRLANAHAEMRQAEQPGFFDSSVVNDELEASYARFKRSIEEQFPGTFSAAVRRDLRPPAPKPVTTASKPKPVSTSPEAPASPAAVSARSTGGGAASPGADATGRSTRALPVRQYMDKTVVPVLREALRALNEERPDDPLQFVADFLLKVREERLAQ